MRIRLYRPIVACLSAGVVALALAVVAPAGAAGAAAPVGTAPQSRDRGGPDDLRRDIVTGQAPATLRLAVPSGTHQVALLVGDANFPGDAMTVSSDGRTLAHLSSPTPTGQFTWLTFPVDGGADGRTVDLDFAADNGGQYWRFAALTLL